MYFNLYPPGRPTRWAITFACQLAFILFGYDQGVFSGIIGNQHFLELMGEPNDTLTGLIVSIYNLGCFSGCILNFFIGDWLGRRRAMWFAMGWIIVSSCCCTSEGISNMIAGWRHTSVLGFWGWSDDGWSFHCWCWHWYRNQVSYNSDARCFASIFKVHISNYHFSRHQHRPHVPGRAGGSFHPR